MRMVIIHDSGEGADRLRVESWGNGTAYGFQFGEAGTVMRCLFFQGDDATCLLEQFDTAETAHPDKLTRDIWLDLLDPYL